MLGAVHTLGCKAKHVRDVAHTMLQALGQHARLSLALDLKFMACAYNATHSVVTQQNFTPAMTMTRHDTVNHTRYISHVAPTPAATASEPDVTCQKDETIDMSGLYAYITR